MEDLFYTSKQTHVQISCTESVDLAELNISLKRETFHSLRRRVSKGLNSPVGVKVGFQNHVFSYNCLYINPDYSIYTNTTPLRSGSRKSK